MNDNSQAFLLLEDGTVFKGHPLGAHGITVGEAVFTTGMNGYIETLTDPSYYGQIVTQTFPLIGNYGIIPSDFESDSCYVRGYIVQSCCKTPSNFRSEGDLDSFLKMQNIISLCDIDTRALTKILRESGVMNAMIISGEDENALRAKKALFAPDDSEEKQTLLRQIKNYKIKNAVENVSHLTQNKKMEAQNKNALNVVLWDFGAKKNIQRELLKRSLNVTLVPANTTAEKIKSLNADGVLLSNGPGDPLDNAEIILQIKKVLEENIPIFGICLGHQMLALANGAKTQKLKYGHRGANQPVKNLQTGRIYISSQNHGYAVKNDSLPPNAVESFVNTNDGTNEGLVYTEHPAFSVQFHPEACAGPLDTSFLFDDFVKLIQDHNYFKGFTKNFNRINPQNFFSQNGEK